MRIVYIVQGVRYLSHFEALEASVRWDSFVIFAYEQSEVCRETL